ncbi:heme-binding protein [Paraburkholderia adhaesiva]|uniref:heme-binding protein n=1 Tax=Paraburkholderia adhaesiva TaxID=2883244 RepID=UPI001F26468C|nr:heme-binding protein [Paraburkholderia adhaesiva]
MENEANKPLVETIKPLVSLPENFKIREVLPEGVVGVLKPEAPLGIALSHFKGTFCGTGFNTIFRPNSAAPTTTTFTNTVIPAPPAPPSENVLELNLTHEKLSFALSLGTVPNRGLEAQNDIVLNGVPYAQAINDVTNPATGRGDGAATAIHFEPGLWMHVPTTETTPKLAASLVRMASIPHGTTINAQGVDPKSATNGPPTIPPVNITPFFINNNHVTFVPFISQTASNKNTPRIPQDLTAFIAAGTITQDILNDPNQVLRNAIAGQTITSTITFTVSTTPTPPIFGGGADNIAFLEGDANTTNPNADTVSMNATFWIEAVEHKIVVPPFKPGDPVLKIPATPAKPGLPAPVFDVLPPRELLKPITITVTSTQIQYSQVVFLKFGGLIWPHVSVATLVPCDTQTVPDSVWG